MVEETYTPKSVTSLLDQKFKELKWTVQHIHAEGHSILSAKPKVGKSWFADELAIDVASDVDTLGGLLTLEGDVLLLALEDNERRLQNRLQKLLVGRTLKHTLDYQTNWKRLDEGCVEDIEAWIEKHPHARLVVIDSIAKILPKTSSKGNIYTEHYNTLATLTELAGRKNLGVRV